MRSTSSTSHTTPVPFHLERRNTLRLDEPYPVRVRGTTTDGYNFDEETALNNLSAGGLYMTLTQPVRAGTSVFALIRLSLAPIDTVPAPCVATRGTVLRVDRYASDTYGVAVKFSQHRFL